MTNIKLLVDLGGQKVKLAIAKPETMDELLASLSCKLETEVQKNELSLYDKDFDEFINNFALSDIDDLTRLRITKKIEQPVDTLSQETEPQPENKASDQINLDIPQGHLKWPTHYVLPEFPLDVKLNLQKANVKYEEDGSLYTPDRGFLIKILNVLGLQMYNFDPWLSRQKCEEVAKVLIDKYPCLQDNTQSKAPHTSWLFKLCFKLSNLRRDFVKLDVPEVSANRSKKTESVGGYTKKRRNKGIANYLPSFQEKEDSQEDMQRQLIEEYNVSRRNSSVTNVLMRNTFSLRRHQVVDLKLPIVQMMEKWPVLFTSSQFLQEFTRLTQIDPKMYFDKLDNMTPALLQLQLKDDRESIEKLVKDLPRGPNKDRTIALLGLPGLLGQKLEDLCDISQDDVTEEEVTKEDLPPRIFSIRLNEWCLIVEREVCLDGIQFLAEAVLFFFILHYVADLEYNQRIKQVMLFIQMGMLSLDCDRIPPKVHRLVQKVTR